jgi:hypothetical protein
MIVDPIAREILGVMNTDTKMEKLVENKKVHNWETTPFEVGTACYEHNCGGCGKKACGLK